MRHAKKFNQAASRIKIQSNRLNAAVVIAAVVIIGVALMLVSHAATPTTSLEAENGTVTCPAVTDTNVSGASNSGAVTFGAGCGSGGTTNWSTTCSPTSTTCCIAAPYECGFPYYDYSYNPTTYAFTTDPTNPNNNAGVPPSVAPHLYDVTASTPNPSQSAPSGSCTPVYPTLNASQQQILPCDNWGWSWTGGYITVNQAGAVVDGVDVPGIYVSSDASGVVVKDSEIATDSPEDTAVKVDGSDFTIEDSTIHGINGGPAEGDPTDAGETDHGVEYGVHTEGSDDGTMALRDAFYNCTECYYGHGTLEDSFLWVEPNLHIGVNGTNYDANGNEPPHYEDTYYNGGTENGITMVIKHNTAINPQGGAASIYSAPDNGAITTYIVEDNLLEGGAELFYAGSGSGVQFNDNRIATNLSYANYTESGTITGYINNDYGAQYGIWTDWSPSNSGNSMTGNIWDENGALIPNLPTTFNPVGPSE